MCCMLQVCTCERKARNENILKVFLATFCTTKTSRTFEIYESAWQSDSLAVEFSWTEEETRISFAKIIWCSKIVYRIDVNDYKSVRKSISRDCKDKYDCFLLRMLRGFTVSLLITDKPSRLFCFIYR